MNASNIWQASIAQLREQRLERMSAAAERLLLLDHRLYERRQWGEQWKKWETVRIAWRRDHKETLHTNAPSELNTAIRKRLDRTALRLCRVEALLESAEYHFSGAGCTIMNIEERLAWVEERILQLESDWIEQRIENKEMAARFEPTIRVVGSFYVMLL